MTSNRNEIPLTKGYVALVDDEDADLAAYKWQAYVDKKNNVVYARRTVQRDGVKTTVQLHRVILDRMGISLEGNLRCDHVDGDGLNNRRSNLRAATPYQNGQNQRRHSSNTSGVHGVSWHKGSQKWRARIRVNGNRINLGAFDTLNEAQTARSTAELKFHGEFSPILSRGNGNV